MPGPQVVHEGNARERGEAGTVASRVKGERLPGDLSRFQNFASEFPPTAVLQRTHNQPAKIL